MKKNTKVKVNVVHRLENSEPEPGEPRLVKLRA
jgi:hypothetical protein